LRSSIRKIFRGSFVLPKSRTHRQECLGCKSVFESRAAGHIKRRFGRCAANFGRAYKLAPQERSVALLYAQANLQASNAVRAARCWSRLLHRK